jgi:hypothetical protein
MPGRAWTEVGLKPKEYAQLAEIPSADPRQRGGDVLGSDPNHRHVTHPIEVAPDALAAGIMGKAPTPAP